MDQYQCIKFQNYFASHFLKNNKDSGIKKLFESILNQFHETRTRATDERFETN
jgi:hypothetical protein